MATFKYVVKMAKGEPVLLDDGSVTVYVKYSHLEKSALFGTGIRVPYSDWQGDQRYPVKGVGKDSKNRRINEFKNQLEDLVTELMKEGKEPTTKLLRSTYKEGKQKAKQTEEQQAKRQTEEDIVVLFDGFLAHSLTCKERSTVKTLAITSINYKSIKPLNV